jgi:membrane peptidoglycan carboxypeptidase
MKKCIALLITLGLVSITALGCSPVALDTAGAVASADATSPPQAPESVAAVVTAESPNFVLLISDEPNDIGDFSELWVTISGVGFVIGDEEGIIEQRFEPVDVNLVGLTGEAAVAIWAGYVPEGDYTKVFLYVDEVWGLPLDAEGEEEAFEVKLPSNKLQIDLPVEVEGEEPTDFVFDISIHRAGNSGQYILKPQMSESGQGAEYRIEQQAQERTLAGKPEWAGKPHESGKPASAGKPEVAGTGNIMEPPDDAGNPEDAGKPSDGGKREEKGRPDWAGTQGGKTEDLSSEDDTD